jgi:hypothetical protein
VRPTPAGSAYLAANGNGITSGFARFFPAAFMVRHNSIPHQSRALSSMNPVNPSSGYAMPGTKSVSSGWDCVTCAEILAHRTQLVRDPDFDPNFNQLVDGRAVTRLDITMDDAKQIASSTPFSTESRRAFVASNLLVLGFARLMETYSKLVKGREQIRVFHNLPSALKWLGLEALPG